MTHIRDIIGQMFKFYILLIPDIEKSASMTKAYQIYKYLHKTHTNLRDSDMLRHKIFKALERKK